MTKQKLIALSVVIPFRNEAGNVQLLAAEIADALTAFTGGYEVVAIDDGSDDETWAELVQAATSDSRWTLARHRTARGKAAALATGFNLAGGEIVATLDGDLQDDPREIMPMVARLNEGFDLVSGWKVVRKDSLAKRIPSKFFNSVSRLISGLPLHDFNCGLKVYRKDVLQGLKLYGELHRFIPVVAASRGYRVTEMAVRHRPRQWGASKFGASRLIKGFLDLLTTILLTRFAKRPLHLVGPLAAVMLVGAVAALIAAVSSIIISGADLGTVTVAVACFTLIVGAVQLAVVGLAMELIVAARDRPERRTYVSDVFRTNRGG